MANTTAKVIDKNSYPDSKDTSSDKMKRNSANRFLILEKEYLYTKYKKIIGNNFKEINQQVLLLATRDQGWKRPIKKKNSDTQPNFLYRKLPKTVQKRELKVITSNLIKTNPLLIENPRQKGIKVKTFEAKPN